MSCTFKVRWFSLRAAMVGLTLSAAGALCFHFAATPAVGKDDTPAASAGEKKPTSTPPSLADFYGFGPLEVFKLDRRSANMISADFNNDKRLDILIVDNGHSRLDLLQQRSQEPRDKPTISEVDRVNRIDSDWRFEHRKIPVSKQVTSIAAGDFNGDGRTDIAYFGVPDMLVILTQNSKGDFEEAHKFRISDVLPVAWNLAAGDLNSDGRDDLVVLAKNETVIYTQEKDGFTSPPLRLLNTSEKLGLAQIADIDGDGRNDLAYVSNDDAARGFCVRLQSPDGKLGPELRFDVGRPRSISLGELDGKPGREIVTVDSQTGRVIARQFRRAEAKPGELAAQLVQYGFGQRGSDRERDLDIGDLDGDGLPEVVVSDPDGASMLVFQQRKGSGLDLGTSFPGLVGAEQIRLADFNRDGKSTVVVLSVREKTLGLSEMEKGRLTFPVALPVVDDPLVMEVADLDGDKQPEIVYIARKRDGGSDSYTFRAFRHAGKEGWKTVSFAGKESVPLPLKASPERMLRLGADKAGPVQFLIFPGQDRPPVLVVLDDKGIPKVVETQGGSRVGDIAPGAFFTGLLDEPGVLVAQKNFARHLRLEKDGQWKVVDQYNATDSTARVSGVAALDLDGKPGKEIVLVDTGVKRLRVLRKSGNLFVPWKEVDLGEFPLKSTRVADLNGDGKEDLLLFGNGRFAVLYSGQTEAKLSEMATFETKLEKTTFTDVTVGDLNGDGVADIAVIDTQSHYVEVLNYDPKQGLRHATHFKIFEEKSFGRSGDGGGADPRESLIMDVTGDGLGDLLLLTHDRLLLYPQDPAPK